LIRSRSPFVIVAGIALLATALCFLFLGRNSLDLDEVVSIEYARSDWGAFWAALSHDTNMALYYVILRVWIGLGTNEFFTRALSVIPAVMTAPLVYSVGARLFSSRVGFLAALLLTGNAFYIQYAQDARSYSLLLCLATLSSYLFVKYVERPSGKIWIGYVAASVLAIYSHFFAALVPVAHWASFLRTRPQSVPWKGIFASAVCIVLFSLPLAAIVVFGHQSENVGSIPRLTLFSVYPLLYLTGGAPWLDRMGGRLLMLAYMSLCLLGLLAVRRACSERQSDVEAWHYDFLLAWLTAPILLTFGLSVVVPLFYPRYLISILPALVLLATLGLVQVRPGVLRAGAFAVVAMLVARSLVTYYSDFPTEDWRGVTEYIGLHAQPRDALLFYALRDPYDYYAGRLHTPETPSIVFPSDNGSPSMTSSSVVTSLSCFHRAWLVLSHDHEPNDNSRFGDVLTRTLARWGSLLNEKTFWGIRVLLYARDQPAGVTCSAHDRI
jgi:4-amino-4-deoxy-L-arabinose transferase-like glycosyltransferase